MTAISGTRRTIKELVDGTIRVQIDIDPQHRKTFFEMFSQIDMPVALAPLMLGKAPTADHQWTEEERAALQERVASATGYTPNMLKGGELAKLAGIMCSDPKFQQWCVSQLPAWNLVWPDGKSPFAVGQEEKQAAWIVRAVCEVDSRAALDHDGPAASRFHELIRKPYHAFVAGER